MTSRFSKQAQLKYEAFQMIVPSFIWNSYAPSHRHDVREDKFKGKLQKAVSPVFSATTDDSLRCRRPGVQEVQEGLGKNLPSFPFLGTPPILVF